jgi:hypothetical protein
LEYHRRTAEACYSWQCVIEENNADHSKEGCRILSSTKEASYHRMQQNIPKRGWGAATTLKEQYFAKAKILPIIFLESETLQNRLFGTRYGLN